MSRRTEQVQDLIQQELGKILIREIEFPVGAFPNILRVSVSPDLRNATVWVGVVPPKMRGKVLKTIERNIGRIQSLLNKRLYMKFVPQLRFEIDSTIDKVDRVARLLEQADVEDANKQNTNES
ncbi:30S ribosome-binding factor RbfA [Patescibacteria group bacterium]